MTKSNEELAVYLSGETQETWNSLLESTREFWLKIAKRSESFNALQQPKNNG